MNNVVPGMLSAVECWNTSARLVREHSGMRRYVV
jgi:hypothetical protein